LDKTQFVNPTLESGDAVIVMDTCYFRRGFGVMVFRDSYTKKNLLWKFLKHETLAEYIRGIESIISNGWNVLGIVCDGKRGLFSAFEGIPVQMCQFHQVAIITRYITKKPKLEAGKELRKIILLLSRTDKEDFISMIEQWYLKWELFLKEKTDNLETGKWHYIHRRLRSAYRSLMTNMPYLFVCREHPELNITNTTNSIEGVFSNLKTKVREHAGLKQERKMRVINEVLAK